MLFDDPACFRLDRIPVRPIHWLWRPYLGLNVRRPVRRPFRIRGKKPRSISRAIQDFLPTCRFGGPACDPLEPVQIRDVLQPGFHGCVRRPELVFAQ